MNTLTAPAYAPKLILLKEQMEQGEFIPKEPEVSFQEHASFSESHADTLGKKSQG